MVGCFGLLKKHMKESQSTDFYSFSYNRLAYFYIDYKLNYGANSNSDRVLCCSIVCMTCKP